MTLPGEETSSDPMWALANPGGDPFSARYDPDGAEAVAARKRGRKRRRFGALVAVLIVTAAVATYIPVTLLAQVAPPTVTIDRPAIPLAPPATLLAPRALGSAVSIVGAGDVEGATGLDGVTIVAGDDAARPIASISKVITALVVLDERPLAAGEAGPTLHFGKAENDTYDKYFLLGAAIEHMNIGTSMSERDTLEMVLAVSASNYAEVLATWAFGSQANYRAAVGRWLAANGLTATTMVEPTGIDDRNRSTPSDLIAIGKLAMANPVIAEIVGSTTIEVPVLGRLANSNTVLGVEGINGIKTGTLDAAGACLLFSAVVDVGAATPVTITGVILGGSDHFVVGTDAMELIRSVKRGFHRVPLVSKGDVFGTYTTTWGDDADIVAGEDADVFAWSGIAVTATVDSDPVLEAPSGSRVGTATFVAGATTIEIPLVLRGAIAGPGGRWRLSHPLELAKQ